MQVVLSGFSVKLFCFVQAKTLCNNNNNKYGLYTTFLESDP